VTIPLGTLCVYTSSLVTVKGKREGESTVMTLATLDECAGEKTSPPRHSSVFSAEREEKEERVPSSAFFAALENEGEKKVIMLM